ncbi:MAG: DUF2845 domain-containing protein [Syntrophobacteraceae bacterium]
MKKPMVLFLAAFLIVDFATIVLASGTSRTFRCGTRLVHLGDSKGEVLSKCGSPSWDDGWYEDRVEALAGARPYYNRPADPLGTRIPLYSVLRVWVDEWTYNLGPSQFMRTLRFENGRLVNVETGDYGY